MSRPIGGICRNRSIRGGLKRKMSMRYACCFGIRMLAIFLFCAATSCSSASGKIEQKAAHSALPREANPQVSAADLAAVVAANTKFAFKAFPILDTTSNNNIFFSPYSITQAFSLLEPGARGTTRSGIEQTLFFQLPQDRLNPALNKLDLLIAGKTTGTVFPSGRHAPELNNANAVWGQQGFSILPAYLDTLAVNFGAGLHQVDFVNATETSRQTINAWIGEQTNNRIQNIIPKDGVSTDTRMVLANAIWFKASWASKFSQHATANRTFNNRDGTSSLVLFMSQWFRVKYAQVDGCQAVDIPYAGEDLSMLVIMPAVGKFDKFLSSLSPNVVGAITNNLTSKEVAFSMPKFTFTKALAMKQILMRLGMTEAFDQARADFSGINGKRDLYVGEVFYKAFVSVDEEGTEAAAASAVGMVGTGRPRTPDLQLSIDHPFIFLIRDRETGLILFMGKVGSLKEL